MGRFATLACAALFLLGGCAGARLEGAERPLTLAQETGTAGTLQQAGRLQWVSDLSSDALGQPPVQFPEQGADPQLSFYPPAPALPEGLAAADEKPAGKPPVGADAPAEPTELAPAEEAAEGVRKGHGVVPGEGATPPVEIEAPAPVPESAARLRRGCGGGCGKACGGAEPCDSCYGNKRCGGYVGGSLAVLPGLGAGLEFGVNFKKTQRLLWSWELGLVYQDLTDVITGPETERGKFLEARVGVRARLNPCCSRWHPTFRAGIGWMNVTGRIAGINTASFDSRGDYFGGYVGAGLEYDLGRRWSTGPEAAVFAGANVNNGDFGLAPTVFWHLNYKF